MTDDSLFRLDSIEEADTYTLVKQGDDDRDVETLADESESTPRRPGGGASPADVALDIVLTEIAQEARLATGATGAAIALTRGGEIICCATTGAPAPDLGVCSNTCCGISDACLRSGRVQRCDDTETDSRVDAVACRSLGVRSIIIAPVQRNEDRLGVIEIFSAHPHAFSERDAQTLQAFSRRIVTKIDLANQAMVSAFAALISARPTDDRPAFKYPKGHFGLRSLMRNAKTLARDWLLTVTVIAVAVLLGWMLGRAGRERTTVAANVKSRTRSAAQISATTPLPAMSNVDAPVAQIADANRLAAAAIPSPSGASLNVEKAPTRAVASPRAPQSTRTHNETSADGLVVYQNGALFFKCDRRSRQAHQQRIPQPINRLGLATMERKILLQPVPIRSQIANPRL